MIYLIAMRALGVISEIKVSQVIGALIMIGGLVAFMIHTKPLDVKVLHHLHIGVTLGCAVLTCVSLTVLKAVVQVYELPN